jgi:hypothetical protein
MLMPEDWNVLSEYLEILAPLKEATARLEGQATQGNPLVSRFAINNNLANMFI